MLGKFGSSFFQIVEILDEDNLYRRIHPKLMKDNGRACSGAFRDTYMSVDVSKLTTKEKSLEGYDGYSFVSIKAGYARTLNQRVYHDPIECNYAHGKVEGKKTDAIAKKLARSAINEI